MTGWHRPDVETSALAHLTTDLGPKSARQIVDGLKDKGRTEGLTQAADLLESLGMDDASAQLRYQATPYTDDTTDLYASTRGEPGGGQ